MRVAYSKLDQPNLLGLLLAALIAAAVGALVAIPVLRLTGLYLALATLAFAQLMDKLVFQASFAYEIGNPLSAERLSILGLKFSGTGEYTVLMAVFFVLVALVVIAVRRGRLGRILVAMRDSQAACGTLGLDLRWMRVGLFAVIGRHRRARRRPVRRTARDHRSPQTSSSSPACCCC